MSSLEVWEKAISNRTEGTKEKYFRHFEKFSEWCKKKPDELREMKWREDQTVKPWERSQTENLVRQYLQAMEENGYGCSSQKLAYNSIRSFFSANGLSLNLTRQDRPSGCAFGSRVSTGEEIRQIAVAAEHLRTRALILFLKDSGLRESDVAKLLWRDLKDCGEGFMGFTIQTKKGKIKARGFIGPETSQVLTLYKEKRLRGADKIPPETQFEDHPVFALFENPNKPMKPYKISFQVGETIRLAGIEGVTPHGLRKFWEQNNHYEHEAYQKQMNGRALNQVEMAYFWKETPELLDLYRKNYRNLAVQKQEFKEIEERLRREYERETEVLRRRIVDLEYRLNSIENPELLEALKLLKQRKQK